MVGGQAILEVIGPMPARRMIPLASKQVPVCSRTWPTPVYVPLVALDV